VIARTQVSRDAFAVMTAAWLGAVCGCAGSHSASSPGVLFESGIGPAPSNPPTAVVDGNHWAGHRFELKHTSRITGAGAYFGDSAPPVKLFAAIVALSGEDDLPDSQDLSTDDCIAAQVFRTLPHPGDAIATMDVTVEPGWYLVLLGSNAFGAEFEGLRPTELPMEFEDNAPGQLMVAIAHGQTGFFLNEGAARFVVHGEEISEMSAGSPRKRSRCAPPRLPAEVRPIPAVPVHLTEGGFGFAVRREPGVACKLSPGEVSARVGLGPITEIHCTTAGALPDAPEYWVDDLVVWEVDVYRSGVFIIADKSGSPIGERRHGTLGISGAFDPATVVFREPGTDCTMTPAQVYALHPDPNLRELRCTSHDQLVRITDDDGNVVNREPIWRMVWDDYYLLVDEKRRKIFGGNLETYPPRGALRSEPGQ
jgi:hypothetical protein